MTKEELQELAEAIHNIRFVVPVHITFFTVETNYGNKVDVAWDEDFEEYRVIEID